uniref:Uncharacterized protein n=1 Tax=Pyricularia oryzae (strain P131) TaxID=1143193 RepID=L7JMV6_PYRO1
MNPAMHAVAAVAVEPHGFWAKHILGNVPYHIVAGTRRSVRQQDRTSALLGTMSTARLLTPLRPLTPSVLPACGDGRDADQVQTGATNYEVAYLVPGWLLTQTHAAVLMETNNDAAPTGTQTKASKGCGKPDSQLTS